MPPVANPATTGNVKSYSPNTTKLHPFTVSIPAAAGAEQLYDLDSDTAEGNDLAGEKPDLVEQLRKGRDAWNAEMIAPRWESPRPPAKKAAVQSNAK